ncbi:N4-gp56 family major capsid protein [Cytobacillus oceanisediminis]|uniref:N4-gp56 family major capsid protein n=1 Tax=Cytobacillus oceanisediminis 2691 TaxID=1196031 RepID=A0A160MAT6_9BACI|nr:N4-gp56 family major capsid protein [Cytobacillus oceanisediminis]AND39613.1 N4-gp56 family major capsid protein [Cytobacillus oceanisediminis 2691]
MAQTKLANLVNPQVMADMISASLPNKIKFAPLARLDDTLVGQAGDTVTIPKFSYIGDADDLTEGVAMGTVVLSATTQSATIKQAGKAVEITDKAALAGYGDPVGEAERQLEDSIAAKVDKDLVTALNGATLLHDNALAVISYDAIVDAVDKFEEEDDEQKILFIHPLQKGTLRKDPKFIENVPNAFMTGVIGEIAGCQVVASKKVPNNAGVYTNFIVKPGALAIYLKKDVEVESQRDILAKTTVISADEHYVAVLENDAKAVRVTNKA